MRIKLKTLLRVAVLVGGAFLSACSLSPITKSSDAGAPLLVHYVEGRLELDALALEAIVPAGEQTAILAEWIVHSDADYLQPDDQFKTLVELATDNQLEARVQFANGLARFLLDPEYVCLRPLFYKYFSSRYPRQEQGLCEQPIAFELISNLQPPRIQWLDPERVSEVHVLFAGNDEKLVSRFGHVSLRLVVCPENDYSKTACDQNLYEHVVVGYRAHIDELRISSLKGLMGDYHAYLFAHPFMDVYREYAIGEFRNVYSLPLQLDDKDRLQLVRGLSEVHWAFSGQYKFLSENCATWLQDLLRHTLTSYRHEHSLDERFWRPDYFFEALQDSHLVDAALLDDLALAEASGYYFPSTEGVYEKAFQLVLEQNTQADYASISAYLSTLPFRRMNTMKDDAEYWQSLRSDQHLLTAQILLEELATVRADFRLMAAFSGYFDKHGIENVDADLKQALAPDDYVLFSKCLLQPVKSALEPIRLEHGIPGKGRVTGRSDSAAVSLNECRIEVDSEVLESIHGVLRSRDEFRWNEIEKWAHYRADTFTNLYQLKEEQKR